MKLNCEGSECDIIDIICASCAVPFMFPIVNIKNEKYIDGGFSKNYPIDVFKDDLENTIGINIDGMCPNVKLDSLYNYVMNMITLVCNNSGKHNYLKKAKISVNIRKNDNGCDFNITKKNKEDMIDVGYNKLMSSFNIH